MQTECVPVFNKVTVGKKFVILGGVLRRFFLYIFNRKYIEKSIAARKGECIRCGACCNLFRNNCGHLFFDSEGNSACKKYKSYRMPNCRIFPIDTNDIKDRNIISDKPCGYYFDN